MARVTPFALTSEQVIALVDRLDGILLERTALHRWAHSGLLTVSVSGVATGLGRDRLFSRDDVARLRMIARLYRREGLSIQKIRIVFARLDADPTLRDELLNARTRAKLIVDRHGRAVLVRPGDPDVEIATGQIRLPLREVVGGIDRVARQLIA